MDNEKLEKAYIDWTKTNYPDLFAEAEGDALTIETIIKDEMEKPELLATFLNALTDKMKKVALKELYADLDEMEDDDAEPILKKLKSIYKSL